MPFMIKLENVIACGLFIFYPWEYICFCKQTKQKKKNPTTNKQTNKQKTLVIVISPLNASLFSRGSLSLSFHHTNIFLSIHRQLCQRQLFLNSLWLTYETAVRTLWRCNKAVFRFDQGNELKVYTMSGQN